MIDDRDNDNWTGRTVIVTGGSGFIGRALLRHLVARGSRVVALSRSEQAPEPGVVWQLWDGTDSGQIEAVFDRHGPDAVFHLASVVHGRRDLEHVLPTLQGNLLSAVAVLTAAAKAGNCRVILAGSLEEPVSADPAPVPASPYAASKWAASGYGRMFHALYGVDVAIARIFMVYGPAQPDVNKLIPYVCLSAARGEAPALMSGGRPVDWIFVDDVAEGLLALGASGVADGRHVDLGTGVQVTTGAIAEKICAIAGTGVRPEFGAVPDRPMEQVRAADLGATEALTGWRPRIAVDEGLERTYRWFRDHAAETALAGERAS